MQNLESPTQTQQTNQSKIHYSIQTKSLALVPYARSRVKEYHSWFVADQSLLYLTGSEPLTLQEEYDNHKSWLEDPSKYTFLILHKQDDAMIGDVNLFFSEWIETNQAEINIMIARKEYRSKGYAKEVMEAIQLFAQALYGRDTLIAKIKSDNTASINFFRNIQYEYMGENTKHEEKEFRKSCKLSQQAALQVISNQFRLTRYANVAELFSQ